jgi:hypothetical protein
MRACHGTRVRSARVGSPPSSHKESFPFMASCCFLLELVTDYLIRIDYSLKSCVELICMPFYFFVSLSIILNASSDVKHFE